MGAQPKSQQSVTTVLLALEEDIVLGRLYPRERLVEEQFALRFGIKRHVVRQILSGLEAAELIVRQERERFHRELYRLCGNDFLADVIDNMGQKANLVRFSSSSDPKYLTQARDEYFGILKALKGTDDTKLAELCVDHMQPSRRIYLKNMARLK